MMRSVGYNPIQAGNVIGHKVIERSKAPDEYARAFVAMKTLATFQKPVYVPVPKRSGEPVTLRCPKCGFSFDRVRVPEGVYCNHCGTLEPAPT